VRGANREFVVEKIATIDDRIATVLGSDLTDLGQLARNRLDPVIFSGCRGVVPTVNIGAPEETNHLLTCTHLTGQLRQNLFELNE
jgi:hypothetical protein